MHEFRWFPGDGRGGFGAPQLLRTARGHPVRSRLRPSGIEVADWNGDGRVDLLVMAGSLQVHFGGEGGFAAEGIAIRASGSSPCVCDWDGDGDLDLVAVAPRSHRIVWFENVGTRTAPSLGDPRTLLPAPAGSRSGQPWLDTPDWDGDGRPDVLVSEGYRTRKLGDAALTADEQERLASARAVLAAIDAAAEKLSRARPRDLTPETMRARQARREELARWAAAPRELLTRLEQKQRDSLPSDVSASRVVLYRR